VKLNEIYSRVQSDLDDLSHNKIVKGDYFNFAQTTLNDISKEALVWLENAEIVFPARTNTVTYSHPQEVLAIEHAAMGDRYLREVSLNAILNARIDRYNRGFAVNESELDQSFYTSEVNGTEVSILLPTEVEKGVKIKLVLIVGAPTVSYELRPEEDMEVPIYMQNALRAGIYYSAIRTLMPREPNKWGSLYPLARDEYNREVRKLSAYISNLKARNSYPQIQPFKFL